MGQDNSCGICGRHYQECRHSVKEHLANEEQLPLCGQSGDVIYIELGCDNDPDNICNKCQSSLMVAARDDFGRFIMLVQSNL